MKSAGGRERERKRERKRSDCWRTLAQGMHGPASSSHEDGLRCGAAAPPKTLSELSPEDPQVILFRGTQPGRTPTALWASPGPSPMCAKPPFPASWVPAPLVTQWPLCSQRLEDPQFTWELMVGRGKRCRAEGAEGGGGWSGEEEEEETLLLLPGRVIPAYPVSWGKACRWRRRSFCRPYWCGSGSGSRVVSGRHNPAGKV